MPGIPSQIGKYELVRRLGQGGMGSVYLARDPDLDRFVAIKVLREQLFDEELLQRFFREARASANLRHDNIITIYDVGQHDHQPYMALEYVDGQTLLEIIRSRPTLPLAEKLSYIEQICAGLHYAHGAGIVHRDIKPANVMVDTRRVIRILDFGIARVEGSGMTRDGAMIGTLNYMSPEQMVGRPVDFRSDIFAVGTLAYELITDNKAFPGSVDEGLLHKLPYEDPPALSAYCEGLPDGLEATVFRALAKRPEDRFEDLEEMRLAIRDVRRDLDPELALETIVVSGRRGPGARSSSSGRSEHPEFAERRARQIAVHLDAARAALARQDVDSAMAACEDALTLAPDNPDALALLAETERARQQRDEQSRARRDLERSVRQRVADADLRLSRGDVGGAIRTLEQALAADPDNAAGLALLPRLRDAAEAAGLPLPTSLSFAGAAPVGPDSNREGPPPDVAAAPAVAAAPTVIAARHPVANRSATAPTRRRTRTGLVATATATIAMAVAGVAWLMSPGGERPRVAEEPDVEAAAPSPEAIPETAAPTPAPSIAPAGSPPEPTVIAAPPVARPDIDAALGRQIAAVTATYRSGDIGAALNGIEPLLDTSNDGRVRELAATLARAASGSMEAAATAADILRAAERAPQTYAAATRAKTRADEALARNRYVEAGRNALAAAAGYRQAEMEATEAAAAPSINVPPRTEAEATVATSTPSPADSGGGPSGVSDAPATPVAAPDGSDSSPAAAPMPAESAGASAAERPTVPARVDPLEAERPGIRFALTVFQNAYREKRVDLLESVFPGVPREEKQKLERNFKDCRDYNVDFTNIRVSLQNEPTLATVRTRSTYTCQPRTGQGAQAHTQEDVFDLEKVAGAWLISGTGSMDAGRVR